jgi:SnoaL-like domain
MTMNGRLVEDWLKGWNTRDLDLLMSLYAEDAAFISPSVLVLDPDSGGIVRGKDSIRVLYRGALERFPNLRFELADVIERDYGFVVFHRKTGVFVDEPGLTVEVFHTSDQKILRNVVYWGVEEVSARFTVRS